MHLDAAEEFGLDDETGKGENGQQNSGPSQIRAMQEGGYCQAIIIDPGIWRCKERNEYEQATAFHPLPCMAMLPKIAKRPDASEHGWQVVEGRRLWPEPKAKRNAQAGDMSRLKSYCLHHSRVISPCGWAYKI